jgi:23S rRNA pseudouridine2604 synthase
MTEERKKLSLKKADTTPADVDNAPRRKPPVRGAGTSPRIRMTAAEAAQAREEAAKQEAARQEAARQEAAKRPSEDARPRQQDRPAPQRQADRPAYGDRRDPGDRGQRDDRRTGDNRGGPSQNRGGAPSRPSSSRGPYQDQQRSQSRPASHSPSHSQPYPPARDQDRSRSRSSSRQDAPYSSQPPAPTAPPREEDGRVRLSKLMSEQGLSSRREADEWIEHGWVRVDGEIVSELGSRIFPDQVITIDPAARSQQAQRVTILIHKPMGYVSGQAEDGYEPAIVLIQPENRWEDDRLPIQLTRGHMRNLAPAGRLDIDSTGMLVLTQDGRVAKQLIGEDSGVEKEYLVRVEWLDEPGAENVSAVVPPEALEALRFGLELDGRQLKPAQVSWQNEQQLRFVLREGRKRQIRRMCEQVGLKVVGLKRVRMGRITLGKLPVGQWRFLRPDERF